MAPFYSGNTNNFNKLNNTNTKGNNVIINK